MKVKSNDPFFNFENEIVVITGSNGQLGLQYVHAFLQRSAKVIGLDISHNKNSKIIEHRNYSYFQCNVTSQKSIENALSYTLKNIGSPTVLINNAAIDSPPDAPISETGPFENYPESSWDNVMDVNVKGVYLMCKIFGGTMALNKKGSIINVSSIYGVVSPDQNIYDYRRKKGEIFYKPVAYSVSKSAILNLTRYLANYWAKKNIRVNTLVLAGVFNNQNEAFLDAYCKKIPIGRMAYPDEYNGPILFLASNASSYMTGAELRVDGGWTSI